MLEGLRTNEIIVGAYSHDGGVCPMLAAHRAGGRTNLISFAKAWDRFASATAGGRSPRRATSRELLVLKTHLEASLLEDDGPATGLAAAIREHHELIGRRKPASTPGRRNRPSNPEPTKRPGDPDRACELRTKLGWSWMRVVRRYDDYEQALATLEDRPGASILPV